MSMLKRTMPKWAVQEASSRFEPRAADSQRRVFEVLVNPDNDGKPEAEKAAIAGMAPRTWRKHRTRELTQEALAARRKVYARHLPAIDEALLRKAKEGSLPHIMLAYERIEGWRPGLRMAEEDRGAAASEFWGLIDDGDRRRIADIFARALRQRHGSNVQSGRSS
jgi:hypothetical protein